MREAIKTRVSRRTFTETALSAAEVAQIRGLIDSVNAVSGLTIEFVEDGSVAFNSFKKSYGMFKNVRSLLLLKGPVCDEHLHEKVGYHGEGLVLDLTDMGLGTCWVAGTFDAHAFVPGSGEAIACVLPVGHVKDPAFKERVIRGAISKKRKPLEQRVTSSAGTLPDWIVRGVEAVRLAPSAVNSQKPMFRYDGEVLTASVEPGHPIDLVDLGIAKRHFVEEAGGSFELGNGGAYRRA